MKGYIDFSKRNALDTNNNVPINPTEQYAAFGTQQTQGGLFGVPAQQNYMPPPPVNPISMQMNINSQRSHRIDLQNKNLFNGYDRMTSKNMSDSDNIALLERYVLGENRQEFFDSLVQNSDTYFYIKFLDQLNTGGVQIPQEIKAEFDDYISSQNTN